VVTKTKSYNSGKLRDTLTAIGETTAKRKLAVARADGWMNFATGLGTALDKSTAVSNIRSVQKPWLYYEDLFAEDPFAHRIAMLPAEESLRQGFRIEGDGTSDAAGDDMQEYFDDMDGHEKLVRAMSLGRALGGAVVLLGADDGRDPSEPLDMKNIRSFDFMTGLTLRNMFPNAWYTDMFAPRLGEPQSYIVTAVPAGGPNIAANVGVTVHESRFLRFDGVVTTPERMQRNNGWGESIYVQLEEHISAVGLSFKAVNLMLQDFSQAVFSIDGLNEIIAGTDDGDANGPMQQRMRMIEYCRSVARAIAIDAEKEKFEFQTRSFSGVPELIDRLMYWLSAVTGIPVTLLFGRAPAGMNATGDSDTRFFYDKVKSYQQNVLRKRLNKLIRVMYANRKGPTGGKTPKSWSLIFSPLWQPTPEELAKLRFQTAQADALDIQNQILTPEEAAISHYGGALYNTEITIDVEARKKSMQMQGLSPEGDSTVVPEESITGAQDQDPVDP
jgi:uncharacterized protein